MGCEVITTFIDASPLTLAELKKEALRTVPKGMTVDTPELLLPGVWEQLNTPTKDGIKQLLVKMDLDGDRKISGEG